MVLGKFIKQPTEVIDYDIDFSQFLTEGDTLVTVGDPPVPIPLDVSVTPAGLVIGGTYVRNGTVVKQWLSGGTVGERYKVTLTVTSGGGRVKQVEFIVRVKDE